MFVDCVRKWFPPLYTLCQFPQTLSEFVWCKSRFSLISSQTTRVIRDSKTSDLCTNKREPTKRAHHCDCRCLAKQLLLVRAKLKGTHSLSSKNFESTESHQALSLPIRMWLSVRMHTLWALWAQTNLSLSLSLSNIIINKCSRVHDRRQTFAKRFVCQTVRYFQAIQTSLQRETRVPLSFRWTDALAHKFTNFWLTRRTLARITESPSNGFTLV